MEDLTRTERFVQELTGSQSRLFAFIFTLLGNEEAARDVLQETNLILWRKADEFCEGTNFGSWACRVAHYQVLAYWRNTGRDRHVFDGDFLRDLAATTDAATADVEAKGMALRQCLAELGASQQELLRMRYASQTTVDALAQSMGLLPGTISNRLYRLRQILRSCIHRRLMVEGT